MSREQQLWHRYCIAKAIRNALSLAAIVLTELFLKTHLRDTNN